MGEIKKDQLIRKIYEYHQRGKDPRGELCPVCGWYCNHKEDCYYGELQDALIEISREEGKAEGLGDVLREPARATEDRESSLTLAPPEALVGVTPGVTPDWRDLKEVE